MKVVHKLLKAILCTAMLVLLASCATVTYIPTDSTVGNMSVKEARKVIVSGIGGPLGYHWTRDVHITTKKLSVTTDFKGYAPSTNFIATFSEIGKISVYDNNGILFGEISGGTGIGLVKDVNRVANAFYVLKQNAINQKRDADAFDANFASLLAGYHSKISSGSTLPEEANKYKVQAEDAVRDKQFDDAADLYAKALKIAPWWPVGRFNRALVLGETGDYGDAMREMKFYLQLVPDAPNARAAQDKIYTWERKAGAGN
jgi:hypothetical protein